MDAIYLSTGNLSESELVHTNGQFQLLYGRVPLLLLLHRIASKREGKKISATCLMIKLLSHENQNAELPYESLVYPMALKLSHGGKGKRI